MLQKKHFFSVKQKGIVFDANYLYKFKLDIDRVDIPANLIKSWTGPIEPALFVSQRLVKLAEELYKKSLIKNE